MNIACSSMKGGHALMTLMHLLKISLCIEDVSIGDKWDSMGLTAFIFFRSYLQVFISNAEIASEGTDKMDCRIGRRIKKKEGRCITHKTQSIGRPKKDSDIILKGNFLLI